MKLVVRINENPTAMAPHIQTSLDFDQRKATQLPTQVSKKENW